MTEGKKEKDNMYLEWLVESRSRNQQSSLRILQIGQEHAEKLQNSTSHMSAFDDLVSAAFSLWRAVFLCDDVDTDIEKFYRDANSFLENLIHNNSVAYPQDRQSRHWAFRYYVYNAKYRLADLKRDGSGSTRLLKSIPEFSEESEAQEVWDTLQNKLDEAIRKFSSVLKNE